MQRHNPDTRLSIEGPSDHIDCDLCVIGAGSGGLSVAAAAVAFGQSVVLVEKHRMGGDCLNYGCVPSKALIAAAHRAQAIRTADAFGIASAEPIVDRARVRDHVRSVIAAIAPNDSVERFAGLGVRVIQATARFIDRRTVVAGETRINARRFVIATGSSPAVPPVPGLADTPYFTNETIFEHGEAMSHLLIIGGGPIGMELAQAHRRLGSRVTVIEAQTALAKDDPELTGVLLKSLRAEGIDLREQTRVERVEGQLGDIRLTIAGEGGSEVVTGTHLLVAAGRKPNVADLGLDAAGVATTRTGITVNSGLVTSNPKVFAIGDCVGGLQFTHVANYHAGIVIRRALFRLPARADTRVIPWVTYTAPELASVGLSEAQAREQRIACRVLRWPYLENDRAQAERETTGHVKVIVSRKGIVLGAGIVGAQAGELIQIWALAVSRKLNIKVMTDFVAPYPTLGEINKRAAYQHFSGFAGNALVRTAIRYLKKLG